MIESNKYILTSLFMPAVFILTHSKIHACIFTIFYFKHYVTLLIKELELKRERKREHFIN